MSERLRVVEAHEEDYKPQVLSIDDSVLKVNGNYVGNIGVRGASKSVEGFYYSKEDGKVLVAIQGTDDLEISSSDVLKLGDAMGNIGFVEVNRILGNNEMLTGEQFDKRRFDLIENIKRKISNLGSLSRDLGLEIDINKIVEESINKNFSKEDNFSPENMLEIVVNTIKEKIKKFEEIDKRDDAVRFIDDVVDSSGILDSEDKIKPEIINVFGFYCQEIKGINLENKDEIIKEIENFPFYDQLLKEYEKSKEKGRLDNRFTSSMLIAFEEIEN